MFQDRHNIYCSAVHWRYAAAWPHLVFFDARVISFIILFTFHTRLWTFVVLILPIVGLTRTSYFDCSLWNVIGFARSKLVGSFRPNVAYTRIRLMAAYRADDFNVRIQSNARVSILNVFKTSRIALV